MFRDEDLRADRQPSLPRSTAKCRLSNRRRTEHVRRVDRYLFNEIKGVEISEFPRMPYARAMKNYGSDKPDIRFGMQIKGTDRLVKGKGFQVFDDAEFIGGICAEGCAEYTASNSMS
jgi:aspartyl-tRNA synthetase